MSITYSNNTGIAHAAFVAGGAPLCGNRRAFMCVALAAFQHDPQPCKRCGVKVARMLATKARRLAREQVAEA